MSNNRQRTEEIVMETIVDHTGKSAAQELPETLGFLNDEAKSAYMGGLFGLMTNIKGSMRILDALGKYLFPVAFAFNVLEFLFYAWKYRNSSNKNLGKTSNLILKGLGTALIGLAVFGAGIITAAYVPIVFIIAMGLDTFVSFGKSIYFGYKAVKAKTPEAKAFHKAKAKEFAIRAGVGLVLTAAVAVALVFAPYIAAAVVATVVAVAVVTVVTVSVLALVQWVSKRKAKKNLLAEVKPNIENAPKSALENNQQKAKKAEATVEVANETSSLLEEAKPTKLFEIAKTGFKSGFFSNRETLLKPIAKIDNVDAEINNLKETIIPKHRKELTDAVNNNMNSNVEKYLWSQAVKREAKVAALDLILDFVNQFDKILEQNEQEINPFLVEDDKEITVGIYKIKYTNINDLISRIDQELAKGKAYQSFFKDVGGVEAIAKQAYKLLLAKVQAYEARVAANDNRGTELINRIEI